MDDTHQTRTSDVAAAATRKRRSSILKSQRPPRTPFSDLEFNVATPTDTTKSRRVSFSKRTGVAEFATNEATTTWKNFYEEHNKSLELSGNDFGVNASKQPIGHIGKRIFDQQFEVEAIDITDILNPSEHIINSSMNNVNFTQQIASLECTGDDRKLTAPQTNFELSTFTDHQSKVFGDDLAIQSMGEFTDRIDVNFSDVQNIGSNDDKDDLDEIQKDIDRAQNNSACHRPSRNARNMSEYIELNFDTTRVAMRNEESDMSITDTVHSPKVQDVSKNFSMEKKANGSTSKDWVTDKENIAVNPYAAPQESVNFAINEEPDKVLVFDGKRLTIQTEKKSLIVTDNYNQRETCLPETSLETPQRKTIVLNINDDLPNYVNNLQISKFETSSGTSGKPRQSVIFNEGDLSMTQPLIGKIEVNHNRRTMIFDSDIGDISMTQAIPNNIIFRENAEVKTDKRRTIVYENDTGDISVTQALPNVILPGNSEKVPERRKTIVYEIDTGNISMTQAVPTNIIVDKVKEISERRKTILYDNDDGNVSITQALPSHIIAQAKAQRNPEKRRTIVYENDTGDISMTQAIPTNILLATNIDENLDNAASGSEKRKTLVFDDDLGDISITKAVPSVLLFPEKTDNKQRTIVYETENDISITQAVPRNFMSLDRDSNITVYDNDFGNISVTQAIPTNILVSENPPHRRRTVVFDDETADLSITQAVPKNRVLPFEDSCKQVTDICDENGTSIIKMQNTADTNKRKTIVFENDEADISMTQSIPANIIFNNESKTNDKRRTIVYEDYSADISITQALPTNVFLLEGMTDNAENAPEKIVISEQYLSQESKVEAIEFQNQDVSMTEIVSKKTRESTSHKRKSVTFNDINEISIIESLPHLKVPEKRETDVSDSSKNNLSITNPIPSTITSLHCEDIDKCNLRKEGLETNNINQDFVIYQTDTTRDVQKWQSKIINQNDADTEDSVYTYYKPTNVIENVIESSGSEVSIATSSQTQLEEIKNEIPEQLNKSGDDELKSLSDDTVRVVSQNKHSILNELLDMSSGSLEGGIDNKNCIVKMVIDSTVENTPKDTENTSSDSLFFITRDSDEENRRENVKVENNDKTNIETNNGRKSIKYEDNVRDIDNLAPLVKIGDKSRIVAELKNKLVQLKSSMSGGKYNFPTNKHHEKRLSLEQDKDKSKQKDKPLNIQNANDTNELLDMLSELTDNSANIEEEEDNSLVPITVQESKALENENRAESFFLKGHSPLAIENHTEPRTVKGDDNIAYEKEEHIEPDTGKSLHAEPDTVKETIALESKSVIVEPRRLSFAPSRQSIALSREELMNNISMAQAALRLSRQDMDETEDIEDTANDTTIEQYAPHKSIRLSNEVVKTLNFEEEDETASDFSLRTAMKSSPLKKTTFGETSFIKDRKAKVIPIPSYLNDVSDGIKELMDDLVKPMADVLPFESVGPEKPVKNIPSTCSTQIQANLITSSQIDICSELMSESTINIKQLESLASGIAALGNRAVAHALKSPIECVSSDPSEKSSEIEVSHQGNHKGQTCQQKRSPRNDRASPKKVLIFDHNNPLNNVLLGPIDYTDVHKYHPRMSSEKLSAPARYDSAQISVNEDEYCNETDRISQHYNVESRLSMKHSVQHAGDACSEKAADTHSMLSNESKPMSVDQSIEARVFTVKDTKVNTMIAMKSNNKLLDASSSLTLVDDALARSTFDINIESPAASSQEDQLKDQFSPVKVIYKTKNQEEVSSEKQDSDFTSNDDFVKSEQNVSKAKKRNSSPPKRDKHKKLTFDLTPKPMCKMQKLSNSPARAISPQKINRLPAERDDAALRKSTLKENDDMDVSSDSSKHNKKKSPKTGKNSPKGRKGTTITVQQLITEYHIETNIDQESLNKQILQALNDPKSGTSSVEPNTISQSDDECKSLEMISSFASSKNEMHTNPSVTTSESLASTESRNQTLKVDWHQDLISELSSKNLIDDCESSVNVVAKIDMLPFMGSQECEWEASSGDTWAFRLLHGRLRLTVRLAHRYDNATRSRVRADTAVLAVTLDTVHQDKKNPIALLCVRFASDAMRYFIGRGCARAADVPSLLRRCSAVARVALRWGRAMHDAHMHLAYTLTPTGHLSLKVANIPLRSVWEVTMRLELVVDDARSAPWPRAAGVRVARVVAERDVPRDRLARLLDPLAHNWGHVPNTVWKIFKYLKHKKRDDATLLGF